MKLDWHVEMYFNCVGQVQLKVVEICIGCVIFLSITSLRFNLRTNESAQIHSKSVESVLQTDNQNMGPGLTCMHKNPILSMLYYIHSEVRLQV